MVNKGGLRQNKTYKSENNSNLHFKDCWHPDTFACNRKEFNMVDVKAENLMKK